MTVAPLVITGMGGKTNMEQFQIDQVVDQLSDLFTETVKALFEKDETRKVSMMIIIFLVPGTGKSHQNTSAGKF